LKTLNFFVIFACNPLAPGPQTKQCDWLQRMDTAPEEINNKTMLLHHVIACQNIFRHFMQCQGQSRFQGHVFSCFIVTYIRCLCGSFFQCFKLGLQHVRTVSARKALYLWSKSVDVSDAFVFKPREAKFVPAIMFPGVGKLGNMDRKQNVSVTIFPSLPRA
jgi:hypothetical protein